MARIITSVDLGVRVYRLRKELDWSMAALARRMRKQGYPTWQHSTVYLTETGKRHLRVYEAYDLADILRVSLDNLAFGMEGDDVRLMLATKGRRLLAERQELQERLIVVDKLLMGYGRADLHYGEVS
jgi:transcriptional regulator with XRE-family HTH domain